MQYIKNQKYTNFEVRQEKTSVSSSQSPHKCNQVLTIWVDNSRRENSDSSFIRCKSRPNFDFSERPRHWYSPKEYIQDLQTIPII